MKADKMSKTDKHGMKQIKGARQGSTSDHSVRARFFPDMIVSSPLAIDYQKLAQAGFRLALLDIDNTLVCHGSFLCDQEAAETVARVKEAGLTPVIASNAPEQRARTFADSLGIDFIANAKKPGVEAICRELSGRGCDPGETVMIGDQLLTDVWSARKAGIPVILTDRRSKREIFTVRLKRPIEWILIRLGGKARWRALREDYSRLIGDKEG